MSRLTASSMSACVDGPKAWRSASRISFSSSGAKSKKKSGSSGATRWLTSADGHPARLEADGLLAVLVDAVVLAARAGGAGLAVADVGAGEVLELERDVLGDVAGPGAVAQAGDEPAAPAERAGVVLERRQERDERVGEARDLVGREVLEDPEIDQQADDRLARPVVRDRAGRGSRGCAAWAAAWPRPAVDAAWTVAGARVSSSVPRSRSRWPSPAVGWPPVYGGVRCALASV